MPLDRGLSAYKTVDDLRATLYVCDWWHCRHVQRLTRGRLFLTHDPSDNSPLPYAYVIYYEQQDNDTCPINSNISTAQSIWRGNVLVVRLNMDNERAPLKRAIPTHMDERDKDEALDVVSM